MEGSYIDEKIVEFLEEYKFQDLVIAIFCILSWRDNRSVLKTSLTLNQSLSLYKREGTKSIRNYKELTHFYEKLKKYFPVTVFDDLTVNDFGEVKIRANNNVYPILIGNGYEFTYEVTQFAIETSQTQILKDALEYSKHMIEELQESNISKYENPEIAFDLPSEQYFISVKEYILNLNLNRYSKEFIKCLLTDTSTIEKAHFIRKDNNVYPLFNASLMVDVYHHLVKSLDTVSLESKVQTTIYKILRNNFNFFNSKNPNIIFPVQILNNNVKDQMYFTFIAPVENGLIIVFNKEAFPNHIIKRDLKKIHELHQMGELILAEITRGKGLAIKVPKEWNIYTIGYDNYTDVTEVKFEGIDHLDYTYMSALDLLLILNNIENFSELAEFLEWNKNNEEMSSIYTLSGTSGLYLLFNDMKGVISEGAINFNMINVSYEFPSSHTYEIFSNEYNNYPYYCKSEMFEHPHQWKIREMDFGFKGYANKSEYGFFGYGKQITKKGFIFFTHNASFVSSQELEENFYEKIRTLDELNQRMIERYQELLEQIEPFNSTCLQLLFMPYNYAKYKVRGFQFNSNNKYVFGDCNHSHLDHIVCRFTVNIDQLFEDIIYANDRSVENQYFIELLSIFEEVLSSKKELLYKAIRTDNSRKKTIDIFAATIDYYYNPNVFYSMPKEKAFKLVRKNIAVICKESGIEPGTYEKQEAKNIVRRMQVALVQSFEEKIKGFSQDELHKEALAHYSYLLHERQVSQMRYSNFTNLDQDLLDEFREKTIETREAAKKNIRSVQYLIESNFAVNRENVEKDVDKEDYEYLLAYADWLVVLQDNSDVAHFEMDSAVIEISSLYNVNTILSEEVQVQSNELVKRKYNSPDYPIKGDMTDKEFLLKVSDAFQEDMGFSLALFFDVLTYLKFDIAFTGIEDNVANNVISVKKEDILAGIFELSDDISVEEVMKILDYLTIKEEKLKMYNGIPTDLLPIWERERRENRFDQKPLVLRNNSYLYSPSVLHSLHLLWMHGLPNFYPPFEIGMDKTLEVLDKWKKRYEDLMVQDLSDIFRTLGVNNVFSEIELYKLDKKGNHPRNLGDYDLLVIDDKNKVIWNLESKVLQKVGSVFEDAMQQRSFFEKHKFDEKFQRRITYLEENYKKLLKSLMLEINDKYEIRSYMVTNKVFTSRKKKVKFPIVSFSEIKEKLEKCYG
ncbi:hypothetical protein [Bacillus sp. ISL-39]|uniref:hypothetical protein n=1 Tax=Bacillus sp. ISL-39 TaxID=2819124 RepID=UPI001BE84643|nr:hypothetical protein [Bacillus sp. ISL-39]MBT2639847.1 hypothetical protein [Bacillus sp. ISL-39]